MDVATKEFAKEVAQHVPSRSPFWHIVLLLLLIFIAASFCNEAEKTLSSIANVQNEILKADALTVHEIHLWRRRVEERPK